VAVHALRVGNVAAGDSVAVIGCGVQGLLLVQLAVAKGARVLAVDVRSAPLALATQLGAHDTLHISRGAPTNKRSPSVVFETAGAASAVETALHMVANGGTVIVVGLATEPVSIDPLHFVRRGLRLLSSLIYEHPRDFQCAIDLVARGVVQADVHVRTIAELSDATMALSSTTSGKTVLDIGGACDGR
jgi:L-gulonate 5-dehydrogenase